MIKVLFSTFLMISLISSKAGHERGNGGWIWNSNRLNFAWFRIPNHPISYCIQSDNSTLSVIEVKEAFESALNRWKAKLNPLLKKRSQFPLSMNFQFLDFCHEKVDLKVSLGVVDPVIEKELKGRHRYSMAFAKVTKESTHWDQGVIFFRTSKNPTIQGSYHIPQWRENKTFELLLTHELGHLFGIDHVAGTIMREDFALEIMSISKQWTDRPALKAKIKELSSIDQEKTILPFSSKETIELDDKAKILPPIEYLSKRKMPVTYKDKTLGLFFPQGKFLSSSVRNVTDFRSSERERFYTDPNCIVRSFDSNRKSHCLIPRLESFLWHGFFQSHDGSQKSAAMYLKNMGQKHHQLKIFNNGKWESIIP